MYASASHFAGFDPNQPPRVYKRNLPHWRQRGATYFVTFRQSDSIPAHKIRQWRHERETWYRAHALEDGLQPDEWQKRYLAIAKEDREYFERRIAHQMLLTLDECHGSCLLRDLGCVKILNDALRFFDGQRYRCGDFAVMPNHVHWLIKPEEAQELADILYSVKRYTARRVNERLGRAGRIWQHESYDRIVRDTAELARTRTYIASNPAKTRLNHKNRYWRAPWLDVFTSAFETGEEK